MYNEVKAFGIAALVGMAMVSCSKDNTRGLEAESLIEQARSHKNNGEYDMALALLDSVDKSYRDCLEQRREGTRLRVETLHRLTIDSIEADEVRRVPLQAAIDSLSPMFLTVSMKGTEGYRVFKKTFKGNEMERTCVQPRIDENGYFFVVVNLQGRKIQLKGISLGDVTAEGSSISMEGAEMMTLSQEAAAALSRAIESAPAGKIKINLVGQKGSVPVTLTADEAVAWRSTWHYAMLMQLMQTANVRREKYEYQLDKLQSQLDSLPEAAVSGAND